MGWPKGKPRTAETRERMSAASKAALADPAVRERISAASKAALADPAVRERMSAARKAAWARVLRGAPVRASWAEALAWADGVDPDLVLRGSRRERVGQINDLRRLAELPDFVVSELEAA